MGYDGISPGPTFIQEKGRESVVRFVNKATVESSIHLHGSFSRAPWDGWAEDVTNPGEYKDYYYPNAQAGRFSWYHDHAMHEVRSLLDFEMEEQRLTLCRLLRMPTTARLVATLSTTLLRILSVCPADMESTIFLSS